MPERSAINQSVQIGVESTPGTAVAAPRRLGSLGFALSPQGEFNAFRPMGQKYPSLSIMGREWSEAEITGTPVYTELPYAFSSVMSTATVVQLMDSATPTGAYRWTFNSATFGNDSPKTYTVEQGDSVRAHRAANVIINEFGITFGTEEIEIEGAALGKAIEDGITLTATPTMLPQIPVRPTEVAIYLDTTSGGLGTTKLTRVLEAEFSLQDRFSPLWVIDSALTSFVTTIEDEPELTFMLTQEADAQGMAHLATMRSGGTSFLRIEAKGPVIYATGTPIRHQLRIDIAGQVSEAGSLDEDDGVYTVEWEFAGVHDATWGKAFTVEVITTTATL